MLLDIVVLVLVLIFFVMGTIDGFIVSVLRLGAWLAGIVSLWFFAGAFGNMLAANIEGLSPVAALVLGGLLAFLLPFVLISLASSIANFFVKKAAPLKFANRLLGGAFGIFKGLAVSFVILTVLHLLPAQGAFKEERDKSTAYSIYKKVPFADLWENFYVPPALPSAPAPERTIES